MLWLSYCGIVCDYIYILLIITFNKYLKSMEPFEITCLTCNSEYMIVHDIPFLVVWSFVFQTISQYLLPFSCWLYSMSQYVPITSLFFSPNAGDPLRVPCSGFRRLTYQPSNVEVLSHEWRIWKKWGCADMACCTVFLHAFASNHMCFAGKSTIDRWLSQLNPQLKENSQPRLITRGISKSIHSLSIRHVFSKRSQPRINCSFMGFFTAGWWFGTWILWLSIYWK